MDLFTSAFVLFFLAGSIALWGWVVIREVQQRGARTLVRETGEEIRHDLPRTSRLPWIAGTFVVAIPVLGARQALYGTLTLGSGLGLLPIWLVWALLLRWCLRSRSPGVQQE